MLDGAHKSDKVWVSRGFRGPPAQLCRAIRNVRIKSTVLFLLISNVKLHAKMPLNILKYSVKRIFFSFHFSVTLMWQLLKRF